MRRAGLRMVRAAAAEGCRVVPIVCIEQAALVGLFPQWRRRRRRLLGVAVIVALVVIVDIPAVLSGRAPSAPPYPRRLPSLVVVVRVRIVVVLEEAAAEGFFVGRVEGAAGPGEEGGRVRVLGLEERVDCASRERVSAVR